MVRIFSSVKIRGWMPEAIAAFSAGRPKESQPIGERTLNPRIVL